jgi:hypothetical protein
MLYEFAIEPDVLAIWDRCRNTLNLMGFRHARAIAAYPTRKRWKKLIFEACRQASCGDREFARIQEKIRQVDAKLVHSARPYDHSLEPESERWVRNAIAQQDTSTPFHAILSTRNPTCSADVVLEEDIDESHRRLAVRREWPVLRQPNEMAAHIRTLVRNSRQLLLVDPHIEPWQDRWWPVVKACLAEVLVGGHPDSWLRDPGDTRARHRGEVDILGVRETQSQEPHRLCPRRAAASAHRSLADPTRRAG